MKSTRAYLEQRLAELAHKPDKPGERILRPANKRSTGQRWMSRQAWRDALRLALGRA